MSLCQRRDIGDHTPDAPQQILLLISVAVFAALGELLVIKALEIAMAVVVAPVRYSPIIWGTLFGWLIFGQLLTDVGASNLRHHRHI